MHKDTYFIDNLDFNSSFSIASILYKEGVDKDSLVKAFVSAKKNQTSFGAELVHSGVIDECSLFRIIASILGLSYRDEMCPTCVLVNSENIPENLGRIRHALVSEGGGKTAVYVAPTPADMVVLQQRLAQSPELADRLRICRPSLLGDVMRRRHTDKMATKAQWMTPPEFSASRVLELPQAFALSLLVFLLISIFWKWPSYTQLCIHILFTLLFFGTVLIRLGAALTATRLPAIENRPYSAKDLPVYSVLVPLYKETAVVSQLLNALANLEWPRSKLDIKLVCECDDAETLAAIRTHQLPPFMEVITVPAVGPRTKPKALNFALQCTRGSFVAVFDAEDRPHPQQLLEAWRAFEAGGEQLACVQAPLIIANFRVNFLTRMFAFEYASLFRGLMPWMARHNLVMPLGGTSNHIRRSCLEKVGGWDSHNVTEDADLGMRLARFGYRVGVIGCGTMEDAPENYQDWRKQRTRWLKGWMQTWLVHMRRPIHTARELGKTRFIVSQVFMLGLILSSLMHPLILVTGLVLLLSLMIAPLNSEHLILLAFDSTNIMLAYLSCYILGQRTMERVEFRAYPYLISIAPYWILISLSAWRAVWQLITAPFLWEKTPHHESTTFNQMLVTVPALVPEIECPIQ